MQTQVHGHEVIAMMLEATAPFTRESLLAAIHNQFGADTRFYTCSAEGLSAAELITFLEERGKFMPAGDGFQFNRGQMCQH
ncbi:MAG: YecH family protein [Verrucomicrobia bacterium]|nr:YecH family protein [Verrucomicrobiota bacterium]